MKTAKKEFAHEPIFLNLKDNNWYFWDETWANSIGPFSSLREAEERLEKYCDEVLDIRTLEDYQKEA